MFSEGNSEERHTKEIVVNQFVFLIIFRMHQIVNMSMSVSTKMTHDAPLKEFYKFDVLIVDANKDVENYATLEDNSTNISL